MLRPLAIAATTLLLTLPLAARAQDNSTPPSQQDQPPSAPEPKPTPKPTGSAPNKDQKTTADPNPFPEAQSEQAAHPDAPAPQNSQQQTKPSTADQNPFPEAQSEKAAHQTQGASAPAPSTAPKSSDENYSSSRVKGLDLPSAEGARASETTTPMTYNPKLARKDAQIGDFYIESGNFKGAYVRFLEANRSDPGNAEAVFGLAESARHLQYRDEALRNYRLYLSALPNGPHAKEIRKALKAMGAAPPA
jgi:tetratricopeptide (TPR) repeat protein